jgi:exodeoxyribonuclease VII small subunit
MKPEPITYQTAYDQLSTLIDEIESDAVPLDALPAKIRLATELIVFCQERLRAVETEYRQAAEGLQPRA